MSVLVVGSVALDTVETNRGKRQEQLGGAACYFACVASNLAPVRLVGVVGNDFPTDYLQILEARQIDLTGLKREEGKTFRWHGRYHDNMVDRDTLDTQLNVFEQFHPTLPEDYRDSQYVFLANIHPELQLQVLHQVTGRRLVACDTMNFWLTGSTLETFRKVLRETDIAFFNDEEARMLSGQHNLVKAAAAIRLMGVKNVIVKRGDAGALLFTDEGPFWAPALPLEEVVDPTGAGDCFAGGVVSYLARSGDLSPASLRRSMIVGSVTASFAVEAFGVERLVGLSVDDILARCEAFRRLVHFAPIEL